MDHRTRQVYLPSTLPNYQRMVPGVGRSPYLSRKGQKFGLVLKE